MPPIRAWFRKYFTRDVEFSKSAVLFSMVVALHFVLSGGIILNNTWIIDADAFTKGFTILFIVLPLLLTTLIGDKIKNRTLLMKILVVVNTLGILVFSFSNDTVSFIGRAITCIATISGFVFVTATLVHETNLLNRGRYTAYSLFIVSMLAALALYFFANPSLHWILVIPMVVFDIYIIFFNKYEYVETENRLDSKIRLRNVFTRYSTWGRFTSFFLMAFVLGLSFLRFDTDLDVQVIYYVLLVMVLVSGVLIDNFGRKPVLITTVLILSIIAIFASEVEFGLWNSEVVSALYGVVVIITVLLFITYSGDSTRDEMRKFRLLIIGAYIIGTFTGFGAGNALGMYIIDIYETNPTLFYYYPELINKLGAFALIVELIILYPLHDSMHSEDINWFLNLRHLYVFNENGICLFDYNFWPDVCDLESCSDLEPAKPLSEDLVSGGLSGIVSMISEITESDKKLRVVDHEDKKLLFHYGKHTIFCLISTEYLNILVAKLKDFADEFEETYDAPLRNFNGGVSVFDDASYLVNKHFKQKFFDDEFMEDLTEFDY